MHGRTGRSRSCNRQLLLLHYERIANALLARDEEGQDLLEYALLVALIALVAIGAVSTVGKRFIPYFWKTIALTVSSLVVRRTRLPVCSSQSSLISRTGAFRTC